MSTAPPTPSADADAAAFMAGLRRLKAWSGLSYRALERRAAAAGHVLPYSTAATMLRKDRLPREAPVAAFVAACGVTGADADAWLDARRRIACGPAPSAAPPVPDTPPSPAAAPPVPDAPPAPATAPQVPGTPPARPRHRRARWVPACAAALVAAAFAAVAASGAFTDVQEVHDDHGTRVTYRVDKPGT